MEAPLTSAKWKRRAARVAPFLAVPLAVALYFGLQAEIGLPLRGAHHWIAAWALSSLGAGIYVACGRTLRQGTGMALMLVGLSTVLISIVNDLAPLIAGGREIRPFTPYQLSTFYMRKLLTDIGYVGAGYLIWVGWRPSWTFADIAASLRKLGLPMGRRSEGASMRAGILWFPVLLFGTIAVDALLSQGVPQLVNNDETGVWDNSNPFNVILLSAAAALGEEILYRGFMLIAFAAILQRMGTAKTVSLGVAFALQAIIFGFAHAGYGNWLHVIEATLFGVISGIAALWLGIWAAIVLHFMVDVFAIGVNAQAPGWVGFLTIMLIVNTGATLVAGARAAWARVRAARVAHDA